VDLRFIWENEVNDKHLNLRWKVLRIGKPLESAHYIGIDDDVNTKFLVAYHDDKMVGCSTLQSDERTGAKFRIRGMAVDFDYQNNGIGSRIVSMLQEYAKEQRTGIWCNARIRAVPMYERRGFVIVSDVFEIEGIGPHHDMEWRPKLE
jgi:GNAT superfamily N-acetyltransferase